MIEELDRTALTHGKLLFPFKLSAANKPCGCSGESRKREKKPRCLPRSTRGQSPPGFAVCPQNVHTVGARGCGAQEPSTYACFPKSMCLMRIGIRQRDAVERRWRKIKMRTEVFRSRRHLGRTPDVAQPQRIAADYRFTPRHSQDAARMSRA